jgi:hypothetical protein
VQWALDHPEEVDVILANVRRDLPEVPYELARWSVCYANFTLLSYTCLVYDVCDPNATSVE